MNKYGGIRNLDELNAAIGRSGETLHLKEQQLKKRYETVRRFYTPSAFVAEGTKRLVGKLPFTDIALLLIRTLRRKRR